MTTLSRTVVAFWAVAFVGSCVCSAQNGISVSKPKVFDSRSLELMTKRFEEDLQDLRFVDKQSLAIALKNFQGYKATESANTFFVTSPTLPQTSVDRVTTTGGASPGSTVTEKTSSAGVTPQLAGVQDALKDAPSLQPTYGPGAEDLLADQVNLTYKIMNLRMILERALSDRLWEQSPRLQAVLGFQISIDPPKDSTDAAAVVEITVSPMRQRENDRERSKAVDLVALMPQEKTYNSVAVSDKANAFGGTAVTSIMNIGFTSRYRSKTVYLYRDTDTTAFDRMPLESGATVDAVRFGWVFRPVLGRRSVAPGLRQLFAVVALPAKDLLPPPSGEPEEFPLQIVARTYWIKYDRDKLTTLENPNKWPRLPNYGHPEMYRVPVARTKQYADALKPVVSTVDMTATGPDCIVISVTGRNFFPGTTVLPDGKGCADSGAALLIKSETALQIRTTRSTLAAGDLVLNGRYGPSVPLRPDNVAGGMRIGSLNFDNTTNNSAGLLKIDLVSPDFTALRIASLPKEQEPLLSINGRLLPERLSLTGVPGCELPVRSASGAPYKADCVRVLAWVPKDFWADDMVFRVRYPLLGSAWDVSDRLTRPSPKIEIVRLGGDGKKVIYAINTANPTNNWKLRAADEYTVGKGLTLVGDSGRQQLILEMPKEAAEGTKTIVVMPDGAPPVTIALPEEKPKPAPVEVTNAGTPLAVTQNDSVALEWSGTGLTGITAVEFEGISIPFEALSSGKTLRIYVPRAVTVKPGVVNLRLKTASETKLVSIRIAPAPVGAAAK